MSTMIKEKLNKTFDNLKSELGYKNRLQAPKIIKVVVSVGTGSLKDKQKTKLIEDRLARITGQKPAPRGAKKSIATFKVRQGDQVGCQVTLRGQRMEDFMDKLINVSLPRTKDFRGISIKGVDDMGNYSLGIKEHIIFPETPDEEIKDVFGMSITIVTTARSREACLALLGYLGVPFKKGEELKAKRGKNR